MRNLISFFLLLLGLTACETDVTDSIDIVSAVPQLVIEGGLTRYRDTPTAVQTIRLTRSRSFLSTEETPLLEDAVVEVSSGDSVWVFAYVGEGNYQNATLQPTLGRQYTLTIEWQGDTYSAAEVIPEVPAIDSLYSVFQEEQTITDEGYFLQLNSRDPRGVDNYYHYRVFRNGEFVTVPDPGNSRVLVLSDEFFDGEERIAVNPNEEVAFEVGDLGGVQQIGITAEHYDYLRQLYEQTGYQGVSFVGNPPPASIRSNVLNITTPQQRALGYFGCTDVVTAEITVRE